MEKIIMNDVVKAILDRRSIRKYEDRQITEEELNTILTCAFNSPSGGNGQQWFLSVVQDKTVLDTISKAFGDMMLSNPETPERIRKSVSSGDWKVYFGAPTVIWVCYPKNNNETNAALLGENIVIAAQSLGLGTCYLGGVINYLRKPEAKELVDLLKVPEDFELLFGIAIGYPLESPDAKPRDFSKMVRI